jgi:tRNA-specific 2-thiouridylase
MKIAVAMSGGVDSSTTAYLLQKEGHDITGLTAVMFDLPSPNPVERSQTICEQLGINHIVADLRNIFYERVIDPFCQSYLNGKTPSPCITCNRRIKFGALLEFALEHGFDALATGHYASISKTDSRYFITTGKDTAKDQSYFLFDLTQDMLSHILFPLSGYTKDETKAIAANADLKSSKSKESQEICFIPDNNYKKFLESQDLKFTRGDIVDIDGNVLGRHNGIHRYTIGQRRGLGISHVEPLYVIEIDVKSNLIIAGSKELLFKNGLMASKINFQKSQGELNQKAYVKIRSTHPAVEANVTANSEFMRVEFLEKTMQISPGQAAVVYNAEGEILCGGWIESSF